MFSLHANPSLPLLQTLCLLSLSLKFPIPCPLSRASIDAVTTSFAAFLAIVGGSSSLDLGKISDSTVLKSSLSFLLGKILNSKPFNSSLIKSHFQRIWIMEKKVKVPKKGDRFLFSFESLRDKKKVL